VDLLRIDLSKKVIVKVPVHTHGDPVGVKLQGGQHEIITREIEIECLPDDIPESFNVEVQSLTIGQSVRAGEIPLSGSMRLVSPADAVISHVIGIKAAAEETPAEPATAEPEVAKKGKKEEAAAPEKKDEKKKK
jgi:large subunit ribosomal protein L25